eukprot:gene10000-6980_t
MKLRKFLVSPFSHRIMQTILPLNGLLLKIFTCVLLFSQRVKNNNINELKGFFFCLTKASYTSTDGPTRIVIDCCCFNIIYCISFNNQFFILFWHITPLPQLSDRLEFLISALVVVIIIRHHINALFFHCILSRFIFYLSMDSKGVTKMEILQEFLSAKRKDFPEIVPRMTVDFPDDDEFVFLGTDKILFAPSLMNYCALHGIFPMAVSYKHGMPIFAMKLHLNRSLTFLDPSVAPNFLPNKHQKGSTTGTFDEKNMQINKKLIRPPNAKTKRPAFQVFMNRKKDCVDIFHLVRSQHGEMWLCRPLRECFFHMLEKNENYEMKVIITAVRRYQYANDPPAAEGQTANEVPEGDLVAGEIGYLVGDIYTSATGGYCVNGAGLLQLRVMAQILRDCGCKVWDLGMEMAYKTEHLNTVDVPREQWVKLVSQRQQNQEKEILERIEKKCGAGALDEHILSQAEKNNNNDNSKKIYNLFSNLKISNQPFFCSDGTGGPQENSETIFLNLFAAPLLQICLRSIYLFTFLFFFVWLLLLIGDDSTQTKRKQRMKRQITHYTDTDGEIDPEEFDFGRQAVHIVVPCPFRFRREFATVVPPEDIKKLPELLHPNSLLGLCKEFSPAIISQTASYGFFPMTTQLAMDVWLFAVMVDHNRCVSFLDREIATDVLNQVQASGAETQDLGLFQEKSISLKKKLIRPPNDHTRRAALQVYMNREEDVQDVFQMIRKQHGDSWVSHPLRLCFYHIFYNPGKYAMQFVITAIRRHRYLNETEVGESAPSTPPSSNKGEVAEGELVAGEIGYLVGDIYTSLSGGYCVNGAGLLQLRVMAQILRDCGCKVWDLGMELAYKKRHLGCVGVPRPQWLQLVKERQIENSSTRIMQKLTENYGKGKAVRKLNHCDSLTSQTNLPPDAIRSESTIFARTATHIRYKDAPHLATGRCHPRTPPFPSPNVRPLLSTAKCRHRGATPRTALFLFYYYYYPRRTEMKAQPEGNNNRTQYVELYLLEEAEKKQFTNFCEVIHSSDGRNYS